MVLVGGIIPDEDVAGLQQAWGARRVWAGHQHAGHHRTSSGSERSDEARRERSGRWVDLGRPQLLAGNRRARWRAVYLQVENGGPRIPVALLAALYPHTGQRTRRRA